MKTLQALVHRGPILAALFVFMGVLPSHAQTEGRVVELTQPVVLYINGESNDLNVGDFVALDQTIRTGRTGSAQIVFPDETRIVVGPSSQVTVDRLLLRSDNTARRFSVRAARGTFRFLSGRSNPRAYSVRTPTATMGIRGTAFDFSVANNDNTDLVVYDGTVDFCLGGNQCARVAGACQTVLIRQRQFSQPETQGERSDVLAESFPYAISQEPLRQAFRTSINDCEGNDRSISLATIALPGSTVPTTEDNEREERSGNPAE